MSATPTQRLSKKFNAMPTGNLAFSKGVGFKMPFSALGARFTEIEPSRTILIASKDNK